MYKQAIAQLEEDERAIIHNQSLLPEDQITFESAAAAKNIRRAIAHLKTESMNDLIIKIRQWGRDKGLIGIVGTGTLETQYKKLMEEVGELGKAIIEDDQVELEDAIGDSTVVLILLADLAEMKFEDCVKSAYNVISKRTGTMIDGQFVKSADLDDDFNEPLPERTCNLNEEACESCQ
jgi:NTP pyrophosphatase (non-canonical NTP hydrolase)